MAQYNTALSIILDQGLQTVYFPGSVVSGRVQLQTPKAQPVFRLYVDFAGRCKASIVRHHGNNGTRHYHSKGYFFYDRTVLFVAAQQFEAGNYTWPFQFTVPGYATPGVIQSPNGKGDDFDANPPWRSTTNTPNEHPLPASFSGFRTDIEYYLKTNLLPYGGNHMFNKDLTYQVPILFSPLRAHDPSLHVQAKSELDHRIQTLKLLPEDSEDRHSFRKRFKGVFQSDSLPSLSFHTVLTFPRYLDAVPDSPVPCTLLVTCVSSAFGDGQPDEKSTLVPKTVTLLQLKLLLRAETQRRAGRHTDTSRNKISLGSFDGAKRIPVQHHAWSGGGPPEPVDLGETFNLRIQNSIVPEFSTYNIAHHFTLGVKLRLDCAAEYIRCDLDYQPIEIVPPPAQQEASGYQSQLGPNSFELPLPQNEYQDPYDSNANYSQQPPSYDQPPPPAYGQYT